MKTIRVIYTTRRFNPISLAIRVLVPRAMFAPALASHCILVDGDHGIEAAMLHGVRRVPLVECLAGSKIIETIDYLVPHPEDGIAWARNQVGKRYDFAGAVGMLAPGRSWQDPTDWFCYELAAMAIERAGRPIFRNVSMVSGSMLMAVIP